MSETNDTRTFLYVTYIKTTPEKLWEALTQGDFSARYWMGFRIESDWKVGSRVTVRNPNFLGGKGDLDGKVLAYDPPRKLTYTFESAMEHPADGRLGPSRVTYELTPVGDMVKLTLRHENLLPRDLGPDDQLTARGVNNGWPAIMSGLKSLMETGSVLDFKVMMKEFEGA